MAGSSGALKKNIDMRFPSYLWLKIIHAHDEFSRRIKLSMICLAPCFFFYSIGTQLHLSGRVDPGHAMKCDLFIFLGVGERPRHVKYLPRSPPTY